MLVIACLALPAARKPEQPKTPPPPPVTRRPAPKPENRFWMAAAARVVALFGYDAEVASTGPGAGLSFGWLATELLKIELSYDYAYHPRVDGDGALQSMSIGLGGRFDLPAGPFGARLGGGLGVLAMGTGDRYDHWGLTLAASAALVWPPDGALGLALQVQPSLVVTAGGSSFFLPIGLAGEVRW